MQLPSKIRKAVALVAKADDKPLQIRTGRSSHENSKVPNSGGSDYSDGDKPIVSVWDRTGSIPRLVTIDTVCEMLALGKSAVHELVAKGSLAPPCKLTPGRRGAARWPIRDVIDFIDALEVQRTAITSRPTHLSTTRNGGGA